MKLKTVDWVAFAIILLLVVVPGPDDLLDFGLPLFESVLAVGYFAVRKFGGKLFG